MVLLTASMLTMAAGCAGWGRAQGHRHARQLTQPFLLRAVWGPSQAERSHYLRVYMTNLRQKLERDPAQPQYILTETGVGYRLLAE